MTVNDEELARCSKLMLESEPWITLRFDAGRCDKAMRGDHKEVYIALADGEFAGFAVVQLYGVLRGYIQTLAVVPGMRGKGLGTALIRYCENRILRDHPNVFICFSSFNPDAGRLYQRLGYQKIGELKDYLVKGYDEIILRKSTVPYAEFLENKI